MFFLSLTFVWVRELLQELDLVPVERFFVTRYAFTECVVGYESPPATKVGAAPGRSIIRTKSTGYFEDCFLGVNRRNNVQRRNALELERGGLVGVCRHASHARGKYR